MRSQSPDTQNLVLAIVLSMLVLLVWQHFIAGPRLKEEQARSERDRTTIGTPAAGTAGQAAPNQAGPQAPTQSMPAATAVSREAALAISPRVAILTPSLKGSVALKGGRIDDLALLQYHETVDPKSPNVVLFSPWEAPEPYFAEYGWLPVKTSLPMPGADTLWQAEAGASLTPEKPLTLTYDNGQGLVFHRVISVDPTYMFRIEDQVENHTGADVALSPYARLFRVGTPKVQGVYVLHEGLIGVAGDAGLQEVTYTNALKEGQDKVIDQATGGWLGITDKYWAAALIPNQSQTYKPTFGARGKSPAAGGKDIYYTDYVEPPLTVPAGGRQTVDSRLYAGAKQVSVIEGYQKALGIKKFDLMIDWGWFYFITKPLFYLMELINSVVHDFGVTILLLTLLVKAAFFPLANKSYESMAKMKKLQPEIEKIKERFKDDKTRQQQETMAFYQKEKINPLAGCLPIMLQIPVFFALYKVLFITIDMRHAPFLGIIEDLSAPDPTSIFNLFGLLPFLTPDFLHVGIWPLLMGITMWLQMQLNPPQPDPIQQQMFSWMPVIFTFMLASFPVGMVIYWAWNNLLSLLQQTHIMRLQGTEVPIKANLKRTFGPVMKLFKASSGAKS